MGNIIRSTSTGGRPVDEKNESKDRNEQTMNTEENKNTEQVVRSHRDLTTISSVYFIPYFLLKIIKRR
ncbi:hypothetical protein RUM44_005425 [Polyplax serrata]|uniref:Uncharacterized protein n=1 Tax=Polyplax serrata TaxID=468196 RepID=A0ABR1AW55_POLSC